MSDERKRENEEEKLKDFFHNVIGIKSEAVLEVLAENSEICNLKARTLLMKENEKVDEISFLYKKGGLVKSYYEKSDGKKQVNCFVLRKLAIENIEIALVCNRMQSVASMREYEYRKMILTCNPVQRYEYFLETYPGLEKKVNKKDIASYLNMTPECFSRMLKKYDGA